MMRGGSILLQQIALNILLSYKGDTMIRTTKAQRIAIKRKALQAGLSYRALRANAQGTIGCDGAIALHWCGMWLCIERDGYCHT